MSRGLRTFVLLLWSAFTLRGALHAVTAPMWDNFDEPGHLAYVLFAAEHGRPPGFREPSFPGVLLEANRALPSKVEHGAPSFRAWRAMPQEERARHRARAGELTRDPRSYQAYTTPNYERQQGPAFYLLAALPARLLRGLGLPGLLVGLRLFCVVLASAAIPLAARALLSLGGEGAVVAGLPLVALLPNGLFAFHRLSNEALVLPLMAAAAVGLVGLATRGRDADALLVGLVTAVGIWTRLTLVCLLGGTVVALVAGRVRRPRALGLSLGLPIAATLVLFAWNAVDAGHLTGLAEFEHTQAGPVTLQQVWDGLSRMRPLALAFDTMRNHLWSGGWAFLRPPGWVYGTVLAALAVLAAVALARARPRGFRGAWPLAAVLASYLAAMAFHMAGAAVAAVRDRSFPPVGAEGWYLDETRVMEAALAALLLGVAFSPRRVALGLGLACVAADLAGTLLLLAPVWGGAVPYAFSMATLGAAIAAAPLDLWPAVPAALLAVYLASVATALAVCPDAARPSAPEAA